MGLVKEWNCLGFTCRVLDGPFHHYNGYIAVPKTHSAYGKNYSDLSIDVHGGLTFGEQGGTGNKEWPDPELWWFGFDTSHCSDRIEYHSGDISNPGGIRWTVEMVARECERMAEQFAEMCPIQSQDLKKTNIRIDGMLDGLP